MSPDSTFQLLDSHKPAMPSGRFEVKITQRIDTGKAVLKTYESAARFRVGGARVALPSGSVESRFPPARSTGPYEQVLPHVVLRRSTLPWERSAGPDASPWLALVLIAEGDFGRISETDLPATDLEQPTKSPAYPGLGERWDGVTARVLDVERGLLETVLPSGNDVSLHAYAWRHGTADDAAMSAVVYSHRATTLGLQRAYLVSLEGRYEGTPSTFAFGSTAADPKHPIRLLVLDRWEFRVEADKAHLDERLTQLSIREDGTRAPLDLAVPSEHLDGPGVELLKAGYAPLRHHLRDGGDTWSWYRGPLIRTLPEARSDRTPPSLPVDHADALVLQDHDNGLLFTGRAAAWELGRHLALENTEFALSVARWKTDWRRRQHLVAKYGHIAEVPGASPSLPDSALAWLEGLGLLEGVPFGYLVPDPRMLPTESVRAFAIDRGWVRCLQAGALRAGPSQPIDTELGFENDVLDRLAARNESGLSGCLIRSEVLEAWPDLRVQGHDASPNPSPVLRRAPLSDGVLLVIFERSVSRLELSPSPRGFQHIVRDSDDHRDAKDPPSSALLAKKRLGNAGAPKLVLTTDFTG